MRDGFGGIGEKAGGLDDDIDAVFAPGDSGGVALRDYLDFFPVDDDGFFFGGDFARVAPVNAVPFEQVGVGLGIRQVVDRDYFQFALVALPGSS